MESLIKLMEEYGLTLRRLSSRETKTYDVRHYRGLPNEEIIEVVAAKITQEDFIKMRQKGHYVNQRWANGFRIAKWVRRTEEREAGWLVKIDNGHGSVQYWSEKHDFFGKTPEEAITKAIKHIKKIKEEKEMYNRLAGL